MRPSKWIGVLAFVGGASLFACSSSSSNDSTSAGADGGAGGDGSSGDGGAKCCPPDSSPGCCMHYGGEATPDGSCVEICDGMPNPDDPGWKLETDSNGCSSWSNHNMTNICGSPLPVVDSGIDSGDASDSDAHDE